MVHPTNGEAPHGRHQCMRVRRSISQVMKLMWSFTIALRSTTSRYSKGIAIMLFLLGDEYVFKKVNDEKLNLSVRLGS